MRFQLQRFRRLRQTETAWKGCGDREPQVKNAITRTAKARRTRRPHNKIKRGSKHVPGLRHYCPDWWRRIRDPRSGESREQERSHFHRLESALQLLNEIPLTSFLSALASRHLIHKILFPWESFSPLPIARCSSESAHVFLAPAFLGGDLGQDSKNTAMGTRSTY